MIDLFDDRVNGAPVSSDRTGACVSNKLRVLVYNYLQPDEGGGGVGVYTNNLVKALLAAGHDVVALSSGDIYTVLGRTPKLSVWRNDFERALISNSPVIAPASNAWDDIGTYSQSTELDPLVLQLKQKIGLIDVFHFQNIEGLTRSFFQVIRKEFPTSKMIFSMHNYNAMCPQVDLWYRNSSSCVDYKNGLNCRTCAEQYESSSAARRSRRLRPLKKLMLRVAPAVMTARRKLVGPRLAPNGGSGTTRATTPHYDDGNAFGAGTVFRQFREANMQLFADTFDHVLAVSGRTKQIAEQLGVPSQKLSVSYIGTRQKEVFEKSIKQTSIGAQLHLAYLGYMRKSKGFDLLLEALQIIPAAIAKNITVTVAAAKAENPDSYRNLVALSGRFAVLRYFNGYSHQTLDEVLTNVNLGVVPPIWEDNLPQVAIEMVARGIPVLTSDRGGAREIAANDGFVFPGGSASALASRLSEIATKKVPLSDFWKSQINIFSMEEHLDDLTSRYYRPRPEPVPNSDAPVLLEAARGGG